MSFRRYDHLERLGHSEVSGIELGRVYVFAKLDGTNASVWAHGDDSARLYGGVACGSRNRRITPQDDNAGFAAWVASEDPKSQLLRALVKDHPLHIVYGEWLVPHTLKTYRPEAWRRFWIFDVFDGGSGRYLSHDEIVRLYGQGELLGQKLDIVEPLCVINDPSEAQLRAQVETNTYLVADGAGVGEGIVAKNYEWKNRFGRQPWAKVVRTQFKEENARAFGTTEKDGPFQVEVAIAEQFVTAELVDKTRAKCILALANKHKVDTSDVNFVQHVQEKWRHALIPMLLGVTYNDIVNEHTWDAVKKHKNPIIDFGKLQRAVEREVKKLAQDLF